MALFIFILSVSIILYVYILYPLILFISPIGSKRKSIVQDNSDFPFVSVVIAAYNEEKVIEEKIRNTLGLDYPREKIEILIGSDGSGDGTDEICKKYSGDIRFTRIEPRQGKANVLNTLVPMSNGSIILFSDANTMIGRGALKKMVKHFYDESVGGVCGRLRLNARGEEGLELYEKFYWDYESGIKYLESRLLTTLASNGGIYSIRKESFKEIPKDTIIDDFWISLNVLDSRKKIIFEGAAVAYEDVSKSIVNEFWRKVRIGSGNLQTFFRRPILRGRNRILLNIIYFSHKVLRWVIPVLIPISYISLLFLYMSSVYFLYLFIFANLLLLIALLGILLEVKVRIISYLSYFFLVNFALLIGYVRYINGKQSVIWRRSER